MTTQEFEFILENGEGYFVEFKAGLDKSFAREVVAFANASGGKIFLGVNDQNEAIGTHFSNRLKSQIQDIAHNIKPSIEVQLDQFRDILIVSIPEGIDKPYQCSDGFYIRMGANSQKMNRNQIIDFLQYEGKIKFEEQFNNYFDFNKYFDPAKLHAFLRLSDISRHLDDIEILENLGVAKSINGTLRMINAGMLFFSNNQASIMEQTAITCAVFEGKEKINILNRKDYTDDIISNINNALAFVKQSLRVKYKMTGEARRSEEYEIPLDALREAIVNAVAHRDYFEKGEHTTIEIFSDRIEIGNPGGLAKGLSEANFGKKSVRRNPLIASLLQRCRFMENMGTGINRIRKLCKDQNLSLPEFGYDDFFTISFSRESVSHEGLNEGLNGGLNEGLNKRQKLIIKAIQNNPGINAKRISDSIQIPISTMERDIKYLIEKQMIERRGSKKTGGYVLL